MSDDKGRKRLASPTAQSSEKVSDTQSDDCYGHKFTKADKAVVERVRKLTGTELPPVFAEAVNDACKVRFFEKATENEVFAAHCSAEWHFARFHGDGASFCPSLYSLALKVAGTEGGIFFMSVSSLARYFDTGEYYIREALHLLADSGFFEKEDNPQLGATVRYHPVLHREWMEKHPVQCCKKDELPDYMMGDELGRQLYAISGGKIKFFPEWLTHLRKYADDETIIARMREFVVQEDGIVSPQGAYKRFAKYLRGEK